MTSRLTHTLKNQLFIYLVVAALAIATPEFAGRAEAQDDSGFYFILEGRFAISEGDETPYAEQQISFRPEFIDPEIGGGGHAGAGYRVGRWDFGVFYSGLFVDGDEAISGTQYPNRFYPLLGYGKAVYELVSTEAEVTYHVLDFEAGYNMKLGQADVRLFGGFRYANLDQDVNTTFIFTGTPYSMDEKRDVDFWGAGIRLGASASANIMGSFGSTASASGTVLFGEQDTLTTQDQTLGGSSIGNTRVSRSDGRTAGNVDGELGLTYTKDLAASSLIFILGYRAEGWFNVNNTGSTPPTISGKSYGTSFADQIFHGPFLRGEWRFK